MTSIIVAYNKNLVIGDKSGKVPWSIKEDMKHFREVTIGNPCVMGRKTWESLPLKFRPLPGRPNFIITKNKDYHFGYTPSDPPTYCCNAIETALAMCAACFPSREVFITGGAQVYRYCLEHNLVDRVLASEVKGHLHVHGDAFFPDIKSLGWEVVVVKEYEEFTLVEYRRNNDRNQSNGRNEEASGGNCQTFDGALQK